MSTQGGTPIPKRATPPPPPVNVVNHIQRNEAPASQAIAMTAPTTLIGTESAVVTSNDGGAINNYTQNRMYYRTEMMNGTDEAARREVERLDAALANHQQMQANLLGQLQRQIDENSKLRSDASAQIRTIEENGLMSVEQIGRALLKFQEDVSKKFNIIENEVRRTQAGITQYVETANTQMEEVRQVTQFHFTDLRKTVDIKLDEQGKTVENQITTTQNELIIKSR